MEVIGRYFLFRDEQGELYGDRTFFGGSTLERLDELREKCRTYSKQLGVEGFEEYEDHSVLWVFRDKFYTTEQIERMVKIKAFS